MAANLIKSVSVNYFRYGSGRFILFLYIHFELYIQFYFYSNVQSHRAVARVRESIFARTTSAPCRAVCTDKKKNTIKQNVNTKYNSTDSRQHKLYYHHVAFVNLILLMCFFAHRCGWPRSALLMGQQCSQMFWIIWHEWRFINDFISERISASSRTHAQLSDQQSLQFEDLRVRISLLLFITSDDVAEFMNTIHS